jgi:ABC-type sugar transport system substrate-binding protein
LRAARSEAIGAGSTRVHGEDELARDLAGSQALQHCACLAEGERLFKRDFEAPVHDPAHDFVDRLAPESGRKVGVAEVKASKGERLRDLIDYAKAGALLADWAIVKTKGHMNALVLIATGPLSTDSMMSGIEAELKHCDDRKTKVMNFPVPDWGTRITPGVQAALLADPTINYIIVIYDGMSPFVVPAVTITGSQKKVGVDAFNGTPFVLGLVQQGQVEMDIGENLDWIGHAIIDAEMRRVCGLPLVANPKIPFYVFTLENAKDAGTPPQPSQGYGDAYVKGYADLWKLH